MTIGTLVMSKLGLAMFSLNRCIMMYPSVEQAMQIWSGFVGQERSSVSRDIADAVRYHIGRMPS